MPKDNLIERLRERYTAAPIPACRVCGANLTIASAGGGEATKWVCSTVASGPSNGEPWMEHYEASEWRQYRPGDSDVIELLDALSRNQALIEEMVEGLKKARDEIEFCSGSCELGQIEALIAKATEPDHAL